MHGNPDPRFLAVGRSREELVGMVMAGIVVISQRQVVVVVVNQASRL